MPLAVMSVFVMLRLMATNGKGNSSIILLNYAEDFRTRIISRFVSICQRTLPSPHSDLVLGMTIGYDSVDKNRIYNDNLIKSGLIHVVVVSGYNISLVLSFITKLVKPTPYSKRKAVVPFLLLFYVILCGFHAPIIRASVMGYLLFISKRVGRTLPITRLLIFTGLLMMIIDPANISSLSFWLSFSATFSLLVFSELVTLVFSPITKRLPEKIPFLTTLANDFCTSISAQILVWPIISYVFGRVSLVSPLSNMFVLWLVPLCTVLGFMLLCLSFLGFGLAQLVGLAIFPLLDLFVRISSFFAGFPHSSIDLKLSWSFIVCYYALTLGFAFMWGQKTKHVTKISA